MKNGFTVLPTIYFGQSFQKRLEIELKTRTQKENFLTARGIAITDIFKKIRRKEKRNLDKFLTDLEYHKEIRSIINRYSIKKIFFTSKYVEKHFLKEFPEITFGICLPSPSPAANIPISISEDYKNYKQLNPNAKYTYIQGFQV